MNTATHYVSPCVSPFCGRYGYKALFLGILLILIALDIHAQVPYQPVKGSFPLEPWRWIDFPKIEGKGVRYLHEYQSDKVWFATNNGVLYYDGYHYRCHTEAHGLIGKPVHLVFVTAGGVAIAATDHGVFRHVGEDQWKAVLTWSSPGEVEYSSITELSGQRLMLSTNLGVICLGLGEAPWVYTTTTLRNKVERLVPDAQIVPFPSEAMALGEVGSVSDVLEARDGHIWFAVSLVEEDQGYLIRFDPKATRQTNQMEDAEIFSSRHGLVCGGNQKLLQAGDERIWVINDSYRVGINLYDGTRWSTMSLGEKFGGDEYATSICQTGDGSIWIGGLGKLYSYDGEDWLLYQSPEHKVPGNKVMLFPAKDGSLWVMGFKSRVTYVDHSNTRWVVYQGLNYQAESPEGFWFLDSYGKAVLQQGDKWMAYDQSLGMIDAPVRMIMTSRGQVWAAGSHQGVAATAFFQDGRWHRQTHPRLSWGIDYRAVFEDRDGALWFGGSVDIAKDKGHIGGVLQLLDPKAPTLTWVHHENAQNGLSQSNAYGIGQSKDGRIWLGGGKLFVYDGIKWERAEQENLQEFVNEVFSRDGLLLVGSRYYGIYVHDGQTWRQFDTDSGLISNTIISLYADSDSSIWAVTESDISRFDGHKWVNHVLPAAMNMDVEGGELIRSNDGSCWINKSPREWKRRAMSYNQLPPQRGNRFITYRYLPDKHPPKTHFLDFPTEIAPEGNAMIAWSGQDYLGMTPNEALEFSYRLDDGPWSRFSRDRRHVFTNLSGGVHRVEVRARDLDFNVDPTPAVLTLRVQVPVWRQPWFIGLISLFVLTLAIFEYRIVVKNSKLEKLNQDQRLANEELQQKGQRILEQNQHILLQQKKIIDQKERLEAAHEHLACSHDRIEQQRDALKEMVSQVEELSRAKLNFFTNISHELRTPLSLLIGPTEQLIRRGDKMAGEQRHDLLQLVHRNANRLMVLINQLLEIRRIEQDSLAFTPEKGHFTQSVRGILDLFRNLAEVRQVSLSLENRLPHPWLAFDKDKVEKILANLLSNAFKHTPARGHIHLVLEVVPANSSEFSHRNGSSPFLRMRMEDDGEGIAAQDLERVFDRYYTSQGDSHLSTGIGLSYVQDLVRIQGGHIDIESEEGTGTTITVDLPYLPCAEVETYVSSEMEEDRTSVASIHVASLSPVPIPATPRQAEDTRQRILIVEDNDDMRNFLHAIFSPTYLVQEAPHGLEGLRMAMEQSPDLIICDVMMPEMDGIEFCREIKSNLLTSHIPVILLTARKQTPQKIEGYHTGADDYMTKPFEPEVLEARVHNLLIQREKLRKSYQQQFMLQPQEVTLDSPDDRMLAKLVKLMEEHIDDPSFNVNKMCEAVELSHMQFIRKIKHLTGKKPVDLLKSFRLTRAQDLLRQNKLTISEVAYLVGYDLPNSFSRAFKKEFGISPSEFLEQQAILVT